MRLAPWKISPLANGTPLDALVHRTDVVSGRNARIQAKTSSATPAGPYLGWASRWRADNAFRKLGPGFQPRALPSRVGWAGAGGKRGGGASGRRIHGAAGARGRSGSRGDAAPDEPFRNAAGGRPPPARGPTPVPCPPARRTP